VSVKAMKAFNLAAAALIVSFNVLLSGAFLASGILAGKRGLVICGIGWALVTVPLYYRQHPAKQVARWSVAAGIIGGLGFLLGLAVHRDAL
jgi:hypothetical protein